MAFHRGPKLVTDGLVLYVDAANRKSYVSGSTTTRSLVGSVTGSLVNGVGFSTGSNGSWAFDGSDDYTTLQALNLSSTNKVTICFFCKLLSYTETIGAGRLILEISPNFNTRTTGLTIAYADDSNGVYSSTFPISISLRGNAGYNISGFNKNLVNDLKWHHWVCIFDKSQTGSDPQETFLYIDGVYQIPTIVPSSTYRRDNTNNFGNEVINLALRPPSSAPGNFELSNLQIYNRALTATEILQNYNATKSRFGL